MQSFVKFVVEDSDFFDKVYLLLGLLFGPLFLAYKAREELSGRYRDVPRGLLYLGGLGAVLCCAAWFFISAGKALWISLITSFGPWLIGLFAIVLVCLFLLPICALGSQLRAVLVANRTGSPRPSVLSICVTCIGLLLVGSIAFLLLIFVSAKVAAIYTVMALLALGFGGLGYIFVPEL
jgi:hypothetical protein